MNIKKRSWITLPAYFALSVGLVVAMSQTASAILIGPGSGLAGATSFDNTANGGRTNITDNNDTAGTLLTAGTYDVLNFGYFSQGVPNNGTVQSFLATRTGGANQYTPLWLGPAITPSGAGIVSDVFAGEQLTLAADTTVYAGFTQTGTALVGTNLSVGNTDHNGTPFALTEGVQFGPFSNNNLGRSYAYEINVRPAAAETVPEPASIAIWSLLGLCLAGYGYRRRRRNS